MLKKIALCLKDVMFGPGVREIGASTSSLGLHSGRFLGD